MNDLENLVAELKQKVLELEARINIVEQKTSGFLSPQQKAERVASRKNKTNDK